MTLDVFDFAAGAVTAVLVLRPDLVERAASWFLSRRRAGARPVAGVGGADVESPEASFHHGEPGRSVGAPDLTLVEGGGDAA